MSDAAPLVVRVVEDGKPGHVNQSLGLAEALARATSVELQRVKALPRWRGWLAALFKRDPAPNLPAPDLILGAGHGTHASLVASARAHPHARSVVLMKPSVPRRWFDLVVVPAHDHFPADDRTFVSTGALNRVVPGAARDPARGLMLIGGESKHFDWNSEAVQVQIRSIASRTPGVQWTVADSRRTPPDFLGALPKLANLTPVPHAGTAPDWLPAQLVHAATVWVTPDSASMVYEALTAGCDVGVFDLPVKPEGHIGWAIAELADAQRITRFIAWCAKEKLHPNTTPLREADRCAAYLLERFFS